MICTSFEANFQSGHFYTAGMYNTLTLNVEVTSEENLWAWS